MATHDRPKSNMKSFSFESKNIEPISSQRITMSKNLGKAEEHSFYNISKYKRKIQHLILMKEIAIIDMKSAISVYLIIFPV